MLNASFAQPIFYFHIELNEYFSLNRHILISHIHGGCTLVYTVADLLIRCMLEYNIIFNKAARFNHYNDLSVVRFFFGVFVVYKVCSQWEIYSEIVLSF